MPRRPSPTSLPFALRSLLPLTFGLALVLALPACGSEDPPPGGPDSGLPSDGGAVDGGGTPGEVTVGPADRPAEMVIPPAYDGETPLPLMILLHGYSANAGLQDLLFGYSGEARRRGFYLLKPQGTTDSSGSQFWNATETCCDFDGSGVDDEGYLMALLDEIEASYPVSAVFFAGHSNGAFMSHRMACHHSDRIAGIIPLAGYGFLDEADCGSPGAMNVLQVIGTMDDTVPPDLAPMMMERWTTRSGCDPMVQSPLEPLDIDTDIAGAETTVERWGGDACGADLQLWSIVGAGHIPALGPNWAQMTFGWAESLAP